MLPPNAQHVLESLNTAVVIFDKELHLSSINPAAEMLFAISANQMIGEDLSRILSDSEALAASLHKTLESGHPFTARNILLTLVGGDRITVDCTVTPISSGKDAPKDTQGLLVEINRIDRRLRLAHEETMLGQQVANRAVLRGMAHEIKNPLGGLRGAAQLLERELKDRSQTEYTRIIIHEADRLRNLVDRMMGPNQPLNKEPFNIHRILQHIAKLIAVEFPPTIDLVRDYDPSTPEIMGDPEQLTQAFLNVVRNSAQALKDKGKGKDGGEIKFRTRIERKFTIGKTCHRLVIRTDIIDNGPGIKEELIDKIFYPMVTDKAEGTGLGLSIAQDIVQNHGGLIACQNQKGRTIFSIYLPTGDPDGI
ncbi:MAG: nitrogen regulation protein NR(II) [Gammaproteobacteria bacterium]|nr:nitrogen regulation protein NR(II) [Gammaproteobacteria bacterium]